MKFGIAKKVYLYQFIIIVFLTFILTLYFLQHERQALNSELDERANALLNSLSINSEYPVLIRDKEAISKLVRGILRQKDIVFCAVEDKNRNILFQEGSPRPSKEERGSKKEKYLRRYISAIFTEKVVKEVSESLILGDSNKEKESIGKAYLEVSLLSINKKLHEIKKTSIIIVIALTILTFLISSLAFRFMLVEPIAHLVSGTKKIAEGDFSHRVPVKSKDEIGELAFSFNKMAEDLKAAREQIEDYNKNLEKKVEERTRELQDTQAKLVQSAKMSAIGQLAGGVAHEINNPMGVILGFAQSIAKRIKEDDPLYMPLKSIEREAIRCKKLVGDLLTFSRTGKTQAEVMDINKTIGETLSLIAAQTKVKNVEIIREYGGDLPQITANKNQIQQVMVNLCNNAIDAMPAGGTLTISTKVILIPPSPPLEKGGLRRDLDEKTATPRNEIIEIRVQDTGKGMTEEVKKHIFEPFFTTKEVGKGTGLGLSLCYEIIQKHNGTIEVESEIGKGTTFTIGLPIGEEFAENGKKKILIVDDDRAIINQIIQILKKSSEKYIFTSATDGFSAGQALFEFNPDLIILDLMLPGIDGFQVCQNIRSNKKLKETKILAITGYNSPENRERILACGADDYLPKPFNIEEMDSKIRGLLEK